MRYSVASDNNLIGVGEKYISLNISTFLSLTRHFVNQSKNFQPFPITAEVLIIKSEEQLLSIVSSANLLEIP